MSRQNVELVRACVQAFDSGGIGAVAPDWLEADFEVDFSAIFPDASVVRGLEELRRFRATTPWGVTLRLEAEEFIELDEEHVLVLVRARATGQVSGAPVENRFAHLYTVRDGKLARIALYVDEASARAAFAAERERARRERAP